MSRKKERKGGNVRKILSEKIKSEDIKNIMVICEKKSWRGKERKSVIVGIKMKTKFRGWKLRFMEVVEDLISVSGRDVKFN